MNYNQKIQGNNFKNSKFAIQGAKDYHDEMRLSVLEDIIINAYNRTRDELKDNLDIDEAKLIINALNGSLYTSHLSDKYVLLTEIYAYLHMNNVNADELLQKIETLTEFQAFTVIRMAIEFWEDDSDEDDFNIIRRIFNITDTNIKN